jgi:hypothetical protein
MEWRTLQGFVNLSSQEIYLQSKRHTLVDTLRAEEGYFQRGWEIPLGAPDDYRNYVQGEAASGLLFDFYLAHHLVPYWLPQPKVRPNAAARRTEDQIKNALLWTYFRLIRSFPTDPTSSPEWPARCSSDHDVIDRILATTGKSDALDDKIDFLAELAAFERSRKTRDPATGQPMEEQRTRYKISQAAWAARFENSRGRQLSAEDELIRVDWDTQARKLDRVRGQ